MSGPKRGAGGVDWDERCRAMARAHRAAEIGPERGDRWERRAARFLAMTRAAQTEDLFSVLGPLLTSSDVVLDVGAGTGRHVVELATRVARVIALEPSAAMRAGLAEVVRERGLANVTTMSDAWPAELPGGCDVAFSSHVFYGVDEPTAFVTAMTRAARRACVLYLAPSPPVCALDGVWEHVHGAPRPRPPGALEAFALLWQLDARPELRHVPNSERAMVYSDAREDLVELGARVGLDASDDSIARVRAALEARAIRVEGGWNVGSAGPNVLISWKP